MPKRTDEIPARRSFERHPDPEQQDRCPGYQVLAYEIGGVPYETLIRCEAMHPHRMELEQPGNLLVPAYGFTRHLATRHEALRAIARRQERAKTEVQRRQERLTKMRHEIEKTEPQPV